LAELEAEAVHLFVQLLYLIAESTVFSSQKVDQVLLGPSYIVLRVGRGVNDSPQRFRRFVGTAAEGVLLPADGAWRAPLGTIVRLD
jgi:hypothetical protein